MVDLNGTRAYMFSHPKANARTAAVESYHLLRNPKIQKYLSERWKIISERMLIKAERILSECSSIAFSNICDYITFNAGSVKLKNSEDLPPEKTAAIQAISQGADGIRIKLHSKNDMLIKLGEREKLFKFPIIPEGQSAIIYLVPPFAGAVTLPAEAQIAVDA